MARLNHFDTDHAAEDIGYAKGIKKMLADKGLEISALSNHLSSQMVLPFNDASLDEWAGTSDKEEMVKLGTSTSSRRLASRAGSRSRPSSASSARRAVRRAGTSGRRSG